MLHIKHCVKEKKGGHRGKKAVIPAFAGVTTFYEFIKDDELVKSHISPPLVGGDKGEGDVCT